MSDEHLSELLPGGWIRVRVPLPYSLRYVNSYLLPEPGGGWTLIDPGLNTPEARGAWMETMERHGWSAADVSSIVLTHQHPDHYGLAGWFQEQAGCPVRMTAEAHRYAKRMWREERSFVRELTDWYRLHGHAGRAACAAGSPSGQLPRSRGAAAAGYPRAAAGLQPGDGRLELGHHRRSRPCRGCCLPVQQSFPHLYRRRSGVPRITPNISLIPGEGEDPDPLRSYLMSLEQLARYEVVASISRPSGSLQRIGRAGGEIAAHHERRLSHIREWLRERPASGFRNLRA